MRSDAPIRYSIVVPFYNEEQSIRPLYEAIVGAIDPLAIACEMIFVDDGSRDATLARATGDSRGWRAGARAGTRGR